MVILASPQRGDWGSPEWTRDFDELSNHQDKIFDTVVVQPHHAICTQGPRGKEAFEPSEGPLHTLMQASLNEVRSIKKHCRKLEFVFSFSFSKLNSHLGDTEI
jgi:hypothetical protein